MSAWRGWVARGKAPESHKTAPVSDSPAVDDSECQPPRLRCPNGETVWICLTPSGGKSAWDTEDEALERAKDTTGACVHPVLIEESA